MEGLNPVTEQQIAVLQAGGLGFDAARNYFLSARFNTLKGDRIKAVQVGTVNGRTGWYANHAGTTKAAMWHSPTMYDDPVAAYVAAELANWGEA